MNDTFNVSTGNNGTVYHPIDIYSRIFWSIYNCLGIPLAILGNGLVLYGTIKYNALTFDKVTIALIQVLAFCDITLVFTKWFMSAYVVIEGGTIVNMDGVFGQIMCFLAGVVSHFVAITEFWVIATISMFKVYTLIFPLHKMLSLVTVRIYIGFLFVFCGLYRALPMAFGSRSLYDGQLYTCEPDDLKQDKFRLYAFVTIFGFIVTPMVLTVLCNIGLLIMSSKIQQKMSGRMRPSRKAIFAVMAVSWLFVISFTPISVRVLAAYIPYEFPPWYMVAQQEICYLNFVGNPICYTITNKNFKNFVLKLMLRRTNELVETTRRRTRVSGIELTILNSPAMRKFSVAVLKRLDE